MSNDELCSLPGWVRSGREWQSLDTKLRLEITLDQVTLDNNSQTLINKNSCVSQKSTKARGERVRLNYSSVLAFQGSNMARMSVLRGESKIAGTRFVSNTLI